VILEKKLLPFAKKCEQILPGTIVREDNASPHAHHYQATVYELWKVIRFLWPSNSPDLNAIEPAWYWLKRQTTKHGVASGVEQMKKDWLAAWEKLPQTLIQKWIERIPKHIKQIIKCGGGNEYKEGRNPSRVRP
jgi:transposase